MTLSQLVDAVNTIAQYERHPEKINVVITTKLPYATCGQRPCVGVQCVGMGFDFEAGQFRITPQEDLMSVKHGIQQKAIK
jgi:hypothetical protein